jgi:hypothetical protein
VFLPYEASGILSSIAGIGEILKEKTTTVRTSEKK